jgi:hypothetical protein
MFIAKVVLWIGIVLMPIGFGSVTMRLSILMPIQARIQVLPQFLHMLENQENLLDFYSQRCRSTLCCLLVSVIGGMPFNILDSTLV